MKTLKIMIVLLKDCILIVWEFRNRFYQSKKRELERGLNSFMDWIWLISLLFNFSLVDWMF